MKLRDASIDALTRKANRMRLAGNADTAKYGYVIHQLAWRDWYVVNQRFSRKDRRRAKAAQRAVESVLQNNKMSGAR